jgi:hypothetical protein
LGIEAIDFGAFDERHGAGEGFGTGLGAGEQPVFRIAPVRAALG